MASALTLTQDLNDIYVQMKGKKLLTLALLGLGAHIATLAEPISWVDRVNPLVGTLSSFEISTGNTYPVISRPWGMNSWTPQTGKMGDGWQYVYTAGRIRGFKQTHQPSPWINDYGQFSIMPVVGKTPVFDEEERASWFSHKSEFASPYLYEVYLADYDTQVRFAPSERAAAFEVHFGRMSKPEERWIIVDAFDGGSSLKQRDAYSISGISRKNSGGVPKNFANYMTIRFKDRIVEVKPYERRDKEGKTHQMLAVRLQSEGLVVPFSVASSFVSEEQALLNLREVEGRTVAQVALEGKNEWNKVLGRIEVHDEVERTRTFYSNLYRCLLFPRRFYEINAQGKTIHYSPYNGEVLPGYMYTDTGVWDTFRALFPLINLVYPEEGAKMQEGMLAAYRESGFFPEWASPGHRDCMVGNNSASVVADAFLKGIGKVDTAELVRGLLKSANNRHPEVKSTGRYGHEYYNSLGYVPTDVGINESAARTLEYAYNDWCIAQVLRRAGAPAKDIQLFEERARNYRKLYDARVGWMRGREKSGKWQDNFNPYKWGDAFTEGNAIHYTWSVFHDVAGLMQLMGGEKAFERKLDSVFEMPPLFDNSYYGFTIHEIREMQIMNMGNYAHGNQPIQHMLYLYNYAGAPHKGQQAIREVMNKLYSSAPDGYCGDEDNGQTSAWYVFSALGFYPVTPAHNQYVIGIPYFREVRLNLPGGQARIIADKPQESYIQSVNYNGKPYELNYVRYEDIKRGGTYRFTLGSHPSAWGTQPSARPYSMSDKSTR